MFPLSQSRHSRGWRWLGLVIAAGTAVVYRAELAAWIAGDRAAPDAGGDAVAFYTCSMDPSVEADHPGNCPICGMALTPVREEERSSGVVRVAAHVRQQIGLLETPVEARALWTRAVATGEVVADDAASARPAPDRAGGAMVIARVYRGDAGDLAPGRAVAVAIADVPLTQWTGAIEAARAGDEPGALRIRVDDPDRALRPGMKAEVQIDRELAPRPTIPAAAVLQVGAQRVVFVDLGDGRFAPRTPKLGVQADGFVEVIDGLAAGDRVVVRGAFLLAAESRIRSDSPLWSARTEPAPTLRAGSGRSNPR